ncbi:MAG: hypothetical protein BWZ08_02006 [candidate division BRC1 bacterium ADurb.BinA292]|nr:MAG: hypothetical protein BWZ08_02006 [candidate division BRC1 bacterium ADurb.BinA292]
MLTARWNGSTWTNGAASRARNSPFQMRSARSTQKRSSSSSETMPRQPLRWEKARKMSVQRTTRAVVRMGRRRGRTCTPGGDGSGGGAGGSAMRRRQPGGGRGGGPVELVAGVSDRDFGAWRFYSDRYPSPPQFNGTSVPTPVWPWEGLGETDGVKGAWGGDRCFGRWTETKVFESRRRGTKAGRRILGWAVGSDHEDGDENERRIFERGRGRGTEI